MTTKYALNPKSFDESIVQQWGCHEVVFWLIKNNMDACVMSFYTHDVNGYELLHEIGYTKLIRMKVPRSLIYSILEMIEALKSKQLTGILYDTKRDNVQLMIEVVDLCHIGI